MNSKLLLDKLPELIKNEINIIDIYKSQKRPNNIPSIIISVYDHPSLFEYLNPNINDIITQIYNGMDNIISESIIIIKGNFLYDIFYKNKTINVDNVYIYHKNKINIFTKNNIKYLFINNSLDYIQKEHLLFIDKNWYNKIGIIDKKIYISPLFLYYYQKNITYINKIDDLTGDYINIFHKQINKIDEEISLFDLIKTISYEEIKRIKKINYEEINNIKIEYGEVEMTPIEYAIYQYINEKNNELKYKLKQIIILLSDHSYLRPPILITKCLKIMDNELDEIIYNISNKYDIYNDLIIEEADIKNINKKIMEYLIQLDNENIFDEFIKNICDNKIEINTISNILKKNSKILKLLITEYCTIEESIEIILLTESLNYINLLKDKEDIIYEKIKKNINHFFKQLIVNDKIVSIYYLLKIDINFLKIKFNDNLTILHLTNNINLIKIIFHMNNSILYDLDKNILLYYLIHKNDEIIIYILNKIINEKGESYIILMNDDNNNNVIHLIALYKRDNILQYLIKNNKEIVSKCINNKNSNNETPILLSCKMANEKMYYKLLHIGADININDNNGNSIYHYICKTGICLHNNILNIPNNYGLFPLDYATISKSYWNIIKK